jgi:hypothetical protein
MRRSALSLALHLGGSLAPIIGTLLAIPAVGRWRVLDDHVLELLARGGDRGLPRAHGIDLFQFASGSAEDNLRMMGSGSLLPWWSDPALKIAFFRPLSSLSHRLDYALWPQHSELMYAHSLLWHLLLLLLVQRLYARFETRASSASLAVWLYALNDAHGPVVSWLSNRNALLSAVGVVATLVLHDRARREGHGPSRLLAPASLALALFTGELGLSAWPYLIAHALSFERAPLARRCAVLGPYAAVTLLWTCAYLSSTAGIRGSGVYLHPLTEPLAFAAELPARASLLLGAAFGPIPADLAFFEAAALPSALGVAPVALGVLVWLSRAALRRDRVLRFWWLGTLLAVLPVGASFPSDRLLVLVNLGAMPIVARAIRARWDTTAFEGGAARACAMVLLLVHGVLSPVLLPWRARQMQQLGAATDRAFACLDSIDDLETRTLIVLGAPADFFVSYLQVERAARGVPRPAHVYWLANPGASLQVVATDERTLEVERDGGFFATPPEALYRSRRAQLGPGQRVSLPGLEARIDSVGASGAPLRVALRFDEPLDAERHIFLALRGTAYERIAPADLARYAIAPAVGLPELLGRSHAGSAWARSREGRP